jgi:amidase
LIAAIEQALEELKRQGAEIIRVEMPDTAILGDIWFPMAAAEAVAAHKAHYPSRADEYGEYFREFLELGSDVDPAFHIRIRVERSKFNDRFRKVLADVDALASPAGGVPFPVSREVQYGPMSGFEEVMARVHMQFTIPANFAGTPALALPCGVSDDGLPYTFQLMGRRLGEATLCRIGHAYERATDWHQRHPNV